MAAGNTGTDPLSRQVPRTSAFPAVPDMQRLGGLHSPSLPPLRGLSPTVLSRQAAPSQVQTPAATSSGVQIRQAGASTIVPNLAKSRPGDHIYGATHASNQVHAQSGGGTHGTGPSSAGMVYRSAEAAPAAKRGRKRKVQDRNLPQNVRNFIPESAIYNQLLEQEQRLDRMMDSRRAEVREAMDQPETVPKRLRVYLYNTHANQPHDENRSSREPPSWVLKVFGRVVDPGDGVRRPDPRTSEVQGPSGGIHTVAGRSHGRRDRFPPFTHFVRRMEVQLDPEQYPDNGFVVWDKQHARRGIEKDSFELRRLGDKEVDVKIRLLMDFQPPRFKVKAELGNILGMASGTRTRLISMLLTYIRANMLQKADDPSVVVCNDQLRRVFNEDTIMISGLSQRLNYFLSPLDPVVLEYRTKLDGPNCTHPVAYDIDIDVPINTELQKVTSILEKCSKDKEIDHHNQKILATVRKINEHRRRRAFFLGFSHSPVDFINALVASQARDLRVATHSGGQDYEAERRTDFFKGKWVEDAVMRYLQKRMASGQ